MVRLLARAALSVLGAAIGLIAAALLLDDFELRAGGFVLTVLIFAGVHVLVSPLARQVALTKAPALIGSTALVATLVALLVTNLLRSSISIRGLSTWVLATIVIWATSLAASVVLPLVLFKKVLAEERGRQG